MSEFLEIFRKLVKEMDSSNILITIVGATTVFLTIVALLSQVFGLGDSPIVSSLWILYFALGLTGLMGALTLRTVIRTANKHPKALDLALIGPPGAGKTVYLTVLYRELEVKQIKGLSFAPYGSTTIETVGNHLSQMRKGFFPPSTLPGTRFLYQARATYQTSIIRRQYRIQINDFEGELLDEFNVQSDAWLHKSVFFDSVISADGLMFMLDCTRLLEKKNLQNDSLADVENLLVSALHIFIEKRSDDPTRPFEIPVAILFSKSDLLKSDKDKEFVISRVPRLIGVCQNRCKYFRYFFVSALGSTPDLNDGVPIPPTELHPKGVVEPLIWFLGI